MIDQETIEGVISVIELQTVVCADREIDGYEYGSYSIPVKYRSSEEYLELYNFVLSHIVSILDKGLDYTDFGFTDEDINYVINSSSELIFYYD